MRHLQNWLILRKNLSRFWCCTQFIACFTFDSTQTRHSRRCDDLHPFDKRARVQTHEGENMISVRNRPGVSMIDLRGHSWLGSSSSGSSRSSNSNARQKEPAGSVTNGRYQLGQTEALLIWQVSLTVGRSSMNLNSMPLESDTLAHEGTNYSRIATDDLNWSTSGSFI